MAPLAATVLALLVAAVSAQSSAQSSSEHIWSSVAWVLHGERTPLLGHTPPALTPLGAQQMFSQGTTLRSRYLARSIDADGASEAGRAPIVGIEANALDNTQLSIMTNTDSFMVTSAVAFLQGLYPPISQAFAVGTGGMDAAELANGSIVNYPLGGYQYPSIKTASVLDFESIWIGGHVGCTNYVESLLDFRNDEIVATVYNNTLGWYSNLWSQFFYDVVPKSMVNYANAYALYDYAIYKWTHDNNTRDALLETDMQMLARFASQEQRAKNGEVNATSSTERKLIRAVGGRTLAAKTVALLKQSMTSSGRFNKLNLAFTTIEPFVSFFALADLTTGPNAAEFKQIPEPGSAMVFELFSIGGNASIFPGYDQLWVRFLYRNGTDPAEKLEDYALFGQRDSRMPFNTFMNLIGGFGIHTVSEWCNKCDSISLFCEGLDGTSGGARPAGYTGPTNNRSAISPTIAGVIGAAVSLAVVGLGFLIAVVLGGIRFGRSDSEKQNSALGGFKGAEKMASDTDLAYAKGGSRHERTGSWELRGGGKDETDVPDAKVSTPSVAGVTVQSRDLTHPSRRDIDDDAISEIGHSPVTPREF